MIFPACPIPEWVIKTTLSSEKRTTEETYMVKAQKKKKVQGATAPKARKISLQAQIAFGRKNRGNVAAIHSDLRKKCLSTKVKAQYKGKVEKLKEFARGMGSQYITKDVFVLWVGSLEDQTDGGTTTAHGYRMALARMQELDPEGALLEPGKTPWARDKDMAEVTKGYRYQSKEATDKPKKGTMTRPMLLEFLGWLRGKKLREDADLAEACHRCGLRLSEALRVLVGDVIPDDHETSTLLIRCDKRVNANSKDMEQLYPKLLDDEAADFLRGLMAKKKHGEPLFGAMRPKARQNRHRALYKEAAITLKWPVGLYYDGPHVNRHGWMGMCRVKMGQALDDAVYQVVKTTRKGYQETTQQRLAKRKKH